MLNWFTKSLAWNAENRALKSASTRRPQLSIWYKLLRSKGHKNIRGTFYMWLKNKEPSCILYGQGWYSVKSWNNLKWFSKKKRHNLKWISTLSAMGWSLVGVSFTKSPFLCHKRAHSSSNYTENRQEFNGGSHQEYLFGSLFPSVSLVFSPRSPLLL